MERFIRTTNHSAFNRYNSMGYPIITNDNGRYFVIRYKYGRIYLGYEIDYIGDIIDSCIPIYSTDVSDEFEIPEEVII